MGGNSGESRVLKEREQDEIKYRKWEQSIKEKSESEITNEES